MSEPATAGIAHRRVYYAYIYVYMQGITRKPCRKLDIIDCMQQLLQPATAADPAFLPFHLNFHLVVTCQVRDERTDDEDVRPCD